MLIHAKLLLGAASVALVGFVLYKLFGHSDSDSEHGHAHSHGHAENDAHHGHSHGSHEEKGHSHQDAGNHGAQHGHSHGHIDPSAWVKRLEDPKREFIQKMPQILEALPLKRGDTVGDIGSGVGILLEPLSAIVGSSGRIYAVEPVSNFVTFLKTRVQESKKLQCPVTVLQSSEKDVKLPSNTLDFAITVESYHHWEHAEPMLKSLRQAMKPNGVFVICEGIDGPGADWSEEKKREMRKPGNHMGHVRDLTRESIVKELENNGFKLVGDVKVTSRGLILIFKKNT